MIVYLYLINKILNIILVFIIQILIVSAYSVEGLWINILAPKFDWDNEVKAIKQGTGSLLAMLVGLGLGLVLYITPIIFTMLGINGLLILLLNSIVVTFVKSISHPNKLIILVLSGNLSTTSNLYSASDVPFNLI